MAEVTPTVPCHFDYICMYFFVKNLGLTCSINMQLYSCTKGHNLQGWPSQSILIHEWEQITFVLMSRVLVTDEKMCVPAMHNNTLSLIMHLCKGRAWDQNKWQSKIILTFAWSSAQIYVGFVFTFCYIYIHIYIDHLRYLFLGWINRTERGRDSEWITFTLE